MSDAGPRPAVLITRPEPSASALAEALAAEGWAPVLSPVLIARAVAWGGSAEGAAALAVTSAAAVRAAPDDEALRVLPVWAVGEATAAAAREAGFEEVRAGPSDAAALAKAIAEALPAGAEILHLRGRHGTAGFAEALEAAGLRMREGVVYEMRPAEALAEGAARALAAGAVRAAPVYSPRSGRILARLAAPFDLSGVTAVAISEAAAAPLQGVGFGRVDVAAAPTGEAMREALARLRGAVPSAPEGGAVLRSDDLLTFGAIGSDGTQDDEMSDKTDPENDGRRGGGEGGARAAADPATRLPETEATTDPALAGAPRDGEGTPAPEPGEPTSEAHPDAAAHAPEEAAPTPPEAGDPVASVHPDAVEPAHAAHDVDGYHDEINDHEHEEPRPGLAARALQVLALLLIGAAAALWFGPRLAPNLPAPVAAWLTPAGTVERDDLAALRSELEAEMERRVAALSARLASEEGGSQEAVADALTPVRERIEALARRMGEASPGELEGRLGEAETTLSGVVARLDTLSAGLEDLDGGGELSPEAMERIAAFSSSVEGLKAEVSSLSERVSQLARRIDEAEAEYEAGRREAMDAAAAAEAEAEAEIAAASEARETAERRAALDSGFAALGEAMAAGEPFAEALAALSAQGEPPEALAAVAAEGVPTLAALREDFTPAARAALEAASRAEAGEDGVSQFVAGMRARLSGVPLGEVEGEGVDAALGEAAARLSEGDVAATLAALDGLPEPAQAALSDWRARAETRAEAERAIADWRAELTRGD